MMVTNNLIKEFPGSFIHQIQTKKVDMNHGHDHRIHVNLKELDPKLHA